MAQYFEALTESQIRLIQAQKLFFITTGSPLGPYNLSPRGHDCFQILNPKQVAWTDYPGSGNETYQHLQLDPRITVMFCDFVAQGPIVRLFGQGRVILPEDPEFRVILNQFEKAQKVEIIRQIFVVDIQATSSSCGSGVPTFDFRSEGNLQEKWLKVAEKGKLQESLERFKSATRPHQFIEASQGT